MRKILLTLFAVLFAVPAFAVEVYNNGENSVGIYGAVLGYMGYGLSVAGDQTMTMGGQSRTGTDGVLGHNMMYGLQNNTRVGTNIKIGNFTAQFELGANEQTLRSSATNTIGFRQAWGAYTFANGSKLLFGKTATPTSMGGIISSFYVNFNHFYKLTKRDKKNYPVSILFYYSTVTDLAKFLGLSTSNPLSFEI